MRIPGDSALQRRSAVLVGMKEGLCDTSSGSSETVFEVATVGSRAVRDLMHLLREVELCRTLEMSSDRLVDALMCANYLGVSDGLLDEVDRYVITYTDPDSDPDPVAYPDSPEFPTAVTVKWLELARLDPDVIVKLSSFSCMWKNLSLAKTAEAAAEFLTALELAIAARATAVLGSLRPSVSPEASRALALTDVLVGCRLGSRNVLTVCSNIFHVMRSCIPLSRTVSERGYVLRCLVAPAIAGATGDILDELLASCCIAHPGSAEMCPDLALTIAERRDSLKMARLTSKILVSGVFYMWVYLQQQPLRQQQQQQQQRTDCLLRQICPKMVLKIAMSNASCNAAIPEVMDRCIPDAASRVEVVCEVLESTSLLYNTVDGITAALDSLGCLGCPGCPSNKQRLLALLKKNLDPVTGIWSVLDDRSVRVIECVLRAVRDDVAVLDILVDAINRKPIPVHLARNGSSPEESLWWIGLTELLRKLFDTSDKDRQRNRFRIALCAAKLRSDLLLQTLGKFDQRGEPREPREQKRSLQQRNL